MSLLRSPAQFIHTFIIKPLYSLLKFSLFPLLIWLGLGVGSQRVAVVGESMQPSFLTGDRLLINTLAYHWDEPARGQVVSLYVPNEDNLVAIKRIIGLPGETINITNGILTIDGSVYREPYIAEAIGYEGHWTVPQDSYFLLGDNRNVSLDSHIWGPVSANRLIGPALFKYWSADATAELQSFAAEIFGGISNTPTAVASQGFQACLFDWVCISR